MTDDVHLRTGFQFGYHDPEELVEDRFARGFEQHVTRKVIHTAKLRERSIATTLRASTARAPAKRRLAIDS